MPSCVLIVALPESKALLSLFCIGYNPTNIKVIWTTILLVFSRKLPQIWESLQFIYPIFLDLTSTIECWHYSLEGAAFQSRLPFDKMSSLEAECFSDLAGPSSHTFIQIRNRILKLWFEDPKKQLTQELAVQKMEVSIKFHLWKELLLHGSKN